MFEERIAAIAAAHGVGDKTPGFALAVEKAGKLLYEGGFGCADIAEGKKISPSDNFIIASNTKQMCCTVILMLADRGLLDLDAPVAPFFEQMPEYMKRVTPRQMMAHTSGIPDYFEEGFEGGFAPEVMALAQANADEVLDYIKTLAGPDFEPDTSWAYSNSTYVMLGEIVRKLTGVGFGHFLEQEVLRPLGMERSFAPDDLVSRDPWLVNGYYHKDDGSFGVRPYDMLMVGFADGNVSSNVQDMLKWHHWLFDNQGPELIKPETKALLTCDYLLQDGTPTGYGLGLFLGRDNAPSGRGRHLPNHAEIWHTGGATGFISIASRFTDEKLSVVLLTNDEDIDRDGIFLDVAELFLDTKEVD